jgi:iron(III) transport system substrate-binding protein
VNQRLNTIGYISGLMLVALLGMLFAGCSETVTKEVEASPGNLTVYSGRSESLVGPIIEQFSAATGIEVAVKYGKTSEIAALLNEEGKKSPADVFFAQDPGGLGSVSDLLTAIPVTTLERVPEWARSPVGKWVGLSGRARVVVYNTEKLTEADLPDDIRGFTDPKWKGRIGWPPGNTSFKTMVTGMRATWGEEETERWLEGILANDVKIYSKNTAIVAATAAGEIEVGFVNHYYLYRFMAEEGESFTARNYHPRSGGPESLVMVAGAGILETAENRENAQRFLDFMLSTVAQQYFASQTYEYPLVEGVRINRNLTPIAEITKPTIGAQDLEDLEATAKLLSKTGVLP